MVKVIFAHQIHPVEPLGIGYLTSSIARGGHETNLVLTPPNIEDALELVSKEVEKHKPDVFAQSIIFGSHGYAIELNRRVLSKHPNLISILGGPAATFTPIIMDRGFDAICRYEGEYPFLEFCNALENKQDVGNIPNIWVRPSPDKYKTEIKKLKENTDENTPGYAHESGFDDKNIRFVNNTRNLLDGEVLDSLPFPDRDILYAHNIFADSPIKHGMLTRGCAFHCTYCHVEMQNIENKGKGKAVRMRSFESLAEEIKMTKELCKKKNMPFKLFYLQDDIFGPAYKLEWAEKFADVASREMNIPMHAHVRFDLIAKDERIARALARAGVSGVHIAIEAGDERNRNEVHRRGMTDYEIFTGAKYLRKYGIKMMTQNILGAVGETRETMIKTLDMNIAVKPTFASASIFQPFPGTSSLEKARDTGVLPTADINKLIDIFSESTFYNHSILVNDPAERRWMEVFQKFFAIAVEKPILYGSGELNKMMDPYLKDPSKDLTELEGRYREHRNKKDEELYGVRFKDFVGVIKED